MSLDLERTVILVNPSSGGGRGRRAWERLLNEAPDLGQGRIILEDDAEGARHKLDEHLADPDVTALLAVGGDGTNNLAINRLLEHGRGDDVSFGPLPAGTGSDFERCLALPRRAAAAWEHLKEATPRRVDVLQLVADSGHRQFVLNIASAGLSGEVARRVNAVADRGHFTYLRHVLQTLLENAPVSSRILVDGEVLHDGGFFLVAVANGQYFGKGMRVAPRAEIDDGLLSVVLVPPVPLWHLPLRLPQFFTGRHIDLPFVTAVRGKTVRFEPYDDFPPFDVDGETVPSGAAEIRVREGALTLLA